MHLSSFLSAAASERLVKSNQSPILTMRGTVVIIALLLSGASPSFGASIGKDVERQVNVPFLNGFYNPNGGNPVDIAVDLYVSQQLFLNTGWLPSFTIAIFRTLWRLPVVWWGLRARPASCPCSMCARSPCPPSAGRAARRRTSGSPGGGWPDSPSTSRVKMSRWRSLASDHLGTGRRIDLDKAVVPPSVLQRYSGFHFMSMSHISVSST